MSNVATISANHKIALDLLRDIEEFADDFECDITFVERKDFAINDCIDALDDFKTRLKALIERIFSLDDDEKQGNDASSGHDDKEIATAITRNNR